MSVRDWGRSRNCLVAAVVMAWVVAGPATVPGLDAAPALPCLAWEQIPSPRSDLTMLWGVDAVSATDIWAVGDNGLNPVIEHYDGTAWSLVPTPDAGIAYLRGVKALATDDVWAVGYDGIFEGHAFAEHWDGTTWSVTGMPRPGTSSALSAIDGTSASDIWAVGQDTAGSLAEHYDGTTWTVVPMDDRSSRALMNGVAAIAPDDVWAVGYINVGYFQPVAEHWDGTAWTTVPIDLPPPGDANIFWGVSASSSTDVWAVGTYGRLLPLMEHWDGATWKRYPAPSRHGPTSVAVVSSGDAWAGGGGDATPASWHWNGDGWSYAPASQLGFMPVIIGLAAVSDRDLWAVGAYDSNQEGQQPLILHSKGDCR